jgi:hypothetical protein
VEITIVVRTKQKNQLPQFDDTNKHILLFYNSKILLNLSHLSFPLMAGHSLRLIANC